MAVIGSPVSTPSSDPTGCDAQRVKAPVVTQLYAVSLPTKRRAVSVNQGSVVDVQLQMYDSTGNPIDISDCGGSEAAIEVRLREVISTRARDREDVTGSVTNASIGLVEFELPSDIYNNPGVYNCEVGLYDGDDDLVFTNQFYVWINRGLFGNPMYPNAGPPTLDEVRMFIRDNAPEENRILDDYEFDLAEICYATELGVRYWNESQPPIDVCFNTKTYCVRHQWLKFIAGHMLITAAHRFRRNHLPYQAGDIAIDDQNKFQQYDQAGMMLIQEYKEWVKQKKVQINCQAAMTSSGSLYGNIAYYSILNTGV